MIFQKKLRNRLHVGLFFIVNMTINGQEVEFNRIVFISSKVSVDSVDNSIKDLADFWKLYLTNYNNENYKIKYWNKVEREQGFTDIVESAQWLKADPFTKFTIIDIRRVDKDFFKTQIMFSQENPLKIYSIFNIYAKKDASGYILYNNFFFSKLKFKDYKIENIHYYYPENYEFNIEKTQSTIHYYNSIAALYNIDTKNELTYIIGNTLHEAYNLIGFDYLGATPESPRAGRCIKNQNIIIACKEDHLHEMVHSLFLFPKGPALFEEGIATYYGGGNGKDYATYVNYLKMEILKNPTIDLSDIEHLDESLNNGQLNNYYCVGAILSDYALKHGGPNKVLELLQSNVSDNFNDQVALFCEKFGIKMEEFDGFLRKLILSYDTSNINFNKPKS